MWRHKICIPTVKIPGWIHTLSFWGALFKIHAPHVWDFWEIFHGWQGYTLYISSELCCSERETIQLLFLYVTFVCNIKIRNEDVLSRISSCKFKPKEDPCSHHWITAVMVWPCLQNEQHVSSQTHSYGNGPWYQQTRKTQGRDGKMISLLAAPSSRLIGMPSIGIGGLILFMEPPSFGTRCKDR